MEIGLTGVKAATSVVNQNADGELCVKGWLIKHKLARFSDQKAAV